MKKLLLAIVISTALATLGILPIASVSCQQAPSSPKMSAVEVCQYVNDILPDEYEYVTSVLRYTFSYSALSAQYLGPGTQDGQILDDELTSTIKELSPRLLRIYKQDLILRTKSLAPEQRDAVFERIRGIPGLRDIVTEYGYTYYVVGERVWQVSVKVTEEGQQLYEGQWVPHPSVMPISYNMQYFLDEATGKLTRM